MNTRIITIIFLLVAGILSTYAQQPSTVKSFIQTTDHIPGNERRNDLNGVPCALVKVQVVDDIERVEGNKIGDIVKKGVEKWIYMCKGSRNIRIHFKNHLPVKVMFQDYKINGLESNRVYELVIEIPDKPTSSPFDNMQQKFVINYSPLNATVMVDSKLCKGNGRIELNLPIGDHSYIIAADGYFTAEGSVKLKERTPREITENLIPENPTIHASEHQKTTTYSPTQNNQKQVDSPQLSSVKKDQHAYAEQRIHPSRQTTTTQTQLTKSFKYEYEGVVFKCKAKKGVVTITGIDKKAVNVTIPSKVEFEGKKYTVREIDTFKDYSNNSAASLIIEEGIEVIDDYAFIEFQNLIDVTIPNSIKDIGKYAFRNNQRLKFNLPNKINESELRAGRSVKL